MKQKSLIRPVVSLCLAALTWLAFTPALIAHPYATCLTNSAGIDSFRVNESNATCKVIGNLGTLTNDLGVLNYPQFGTNGLVVTNLTASGMTGGVFSVVL